MAQWKQLKSSRVFTDFKPVKNPRWLWPRYGKSYDPLVWVKTDGKAAHDTANPMPGTGLSSL